MAHDPVGEMIALLSRERAALIAGDLTGIDAMMRAKDALLPGLTAARPSRDQAQALHRASQRNARLIAAALAGLKAAARRIADSGARAELTAYDRAGARMSPPATPVKLNRRT